MVDEGERKEKEGRMYVRRERKKRKGRIGVILKGWIRG